MASREATSATKRTLALAFGDAVFTQDMAKGVGISRHQLASALRAGKIHRLRCNAYVVGREAGPANLLRHLLDRLEDRGITAVVGGVTAAEMWGIPVAGAHGPVTKRPLTLLIPRSSSLHAGERVGVLLRKVDLTPDQVTVGADGLPITTPLRTGLDLVRRSGLSTHLACIPLCGAVRRHLAWKSLVDDGGATLSDHQITRLASDENRRWRSIADLHETAAAMGIRLSQALAAADPRLESALESASWGQFAECGRPMPVPQVWVRGESGKTYRVDFDLDGALGEADGDLKYLTGDRLLSEKRRQADIEAAGHVVVRWDWADITRRPETVFRRIDAARRLRRVA